MRWLRVAERIALPCSRARERGFLLGLESYGGSVWLTPQDYAAWRFRRVPYLERAVRGTPKRLSFTVSELRCNARDAGLRPCWTAYVSWGSGHRVPLRFGRSGRLQIEQAYATQWLRPKTIAF